MADNLQDPSDRRRALSAIFAVSLDVRAREKPPSLEDDSLSAWPMEANQRPEQESGFFSIWSRVPESNR